MAVCCVTALMACPWPALSQPDDAGALNVVEAGADPTGATDCTDLLTRLHATGRRVYYPTGAYRFNGRRLDLSGGVTFEAAGGVTVRNDISPQNILEFDDAGNLVGLVHNHLELNEADMGGPGPVDVGNLVRPPVSTADHRARADLLAYWYNDFGLEHRRIHAPQRGWIGWYYWSWNFHDADRDGYDPARHPLLGFYRGDDPMVLDWQCYWLREYGVRGVILYAGSPRNDPDAFAIDAWRAPEHGNHWIHQLLTAAPNFRGLKYVMAAYTPWTKDAPPQERAMVEATWERIIEQIYLRYPNSYAIQRDGKTYPALYLHPEQAVRGVFDNYNGARSTTKFYRRIARKFQDAGYGGVALFARQAIGGSMMDFAKLEQDGVPHFVVEYANDHSSGNTYAARVANYNPPTSPDRILNVCTAKHSHTPHPSKWNCPGHSPALFGEMLRKSVAHIEGHNLERIITCYNVAEWAEGGPALQPNMQDRFGYLEAVGDVLVIPQTRP